MHEPANAFYGLMAMLATIFGTVVFTGGLMLVLVALFPNVTARQAIVFRENSVVSFFVGLLVFVMFAVVGKVVEHVPPAVFVNFTVFLVLVLLSIPSAAENVGRKIYLVAGREGNRVTHVLAGWPVFAFACCVPILGWFLILPFGALTGLGSFIVSLFRRDL